MKNLKGKVGIFTGGGSGMGRATGYLWASKGGNPIFISRTAKKVEESAKYCKDKFGVDSLAISIDLGETGNTDKVVEQVLEKFGRIDLLANFAGNPTNYGERARKQIDEISDEEWHDVWSVDFEVTRKMTKSVLPTMKKQNEGFILGISSTPTEDRKWVSDDMFAWARAAVHKLIEKVADHSEQEKQGIRAYLIAPGNVFNPTTYSQYNEEERKEADEYGWISSEQIAAVVLWIFEQKLKKPNGDVIIFDAKSAESVYKEAQEKYTKFEPAE